jgi:pre-rRNA-processing protein TSR1
MVSMDIDEDVTSMDANPTSTILAIPTSQQESLTPLADDEDTEMADDSKSLHSHPSQPQKGVRIDDHYYFADDEPEIVKKKAANDYQAAWYISDSDESDNDNDDEPEVEMDDIYDNESVASYHEDPSETGDIVSEMHVDLSPEEEARQ